jgi:hypothetical protein
MVCGSIIEIGARIEFNEDAPKHTGISKQQETDPERQSGD